MLYGYEKETRFKGFKSLQLQISLLSKEMISLGLDKNLIQYFCTKFGVNQEFYSCWLNDVRDFAELVILYVPELKEKVMADLKELKMALAA